MLEEHITSHFTRGSEKRRRASLSVELHGDKDEQRVWAVSPAVYGDYRATMRGVTHARPEWPVKQCGQLTSGPHPYFIISRIFNHPNFEIRMGDFPNVQNLPNFVS
jgi:hypothetical protein